MTGIKKINFQLATLRKQAGLTQREVADRMAVSFQTISKWENSITLPDITILPMLSELFGVTVDQLLGLQPLSDEYISKRTDSKEFWDQKLEYLIRSRSAYWNQDYAKFLIDVVWKIEEPVEVLDCGCGYGFLGLLLLPLLPTGSTYTGIDFSEELLAKGRSLFAERELPGKLVHTDFMNAPIGKKYDIVMCQGVLRHLGNAADFLKKMLRHGKTEALIICIDVNREFECDGLYIEGMDYSFLCEHNGLEKLWSTELENENRDYAAAMRTAYIMKEHGLKNIDIRMNDKVSFVHPGLEDYHQFTEDFVRFNEWGYGIRKEQQEEKIMVTMNHGMSRREAEDYFCKNRIIADFFESHKGEVSFTHFKGNMITFGWKQ